MCSYVSFIQYSNEKSEIKTHNSNIGVHTFCLDTFIWLVGQFCPCEALLRFAVCRIVSDWILTL